jgi:hypothetical protein
VESLRVTNVSNLSPNLKQLLSNCPRALGIADQIGLAMLLETTLFFVTNVWQSLVSVNTPPVYRSYLTWGADSGAQPITNDDSTLILAVNGEIYNHRALRKSLKKEHHFKTHSDCEVILHLVYNT